MRIDRNLYKSCCLFVCPRDHWPQCIPKRLYRVWFCSTDPVKSSDKFAILCCLEQRKTR